MGGGGGGGGDQRALLCVCNLLGGCPALAEGAGGGGYAMLPAAGRVCSVHCARANVGPTVRRGNVPWHFRTPSGAGGGVRARRCSRPECDPCPQAAHASV